MKNGDAMSRASRKSSLLGAPKAKFFYGKAAWSENRPAMGSGGPAVELALRCALSAPPFGLRRASLRASSTNDPTAKPKKGDISILLRKGTFLFCFDIDVYITLTDLGDHN